MGCEYALVTRGLWSVSELGNVSKADESMDGWKLAGAEPAKGVVTRLGSTLSLDTSLVAAEVCCCEVILCNGLKVLGKGELDVGVSDEVPGIGELDTGITAEVPDVCNEDWLAIVLV